MMTVDLRGFTYYPEDLYDYERWESNFSYLQVTHHRNHYYIGIKNDLFSTLGGDNLIQTDLSIALNIVRFKAINEFFSDEY